MRISLLATSMLAGSFALSGCTHGDTPPPAAVAEQTATVSDIAVGPVTPAPAAKPQIGNYGFDEAGMDRSVAPGDNFYAYANGAWARNTPVPADKSNYGAFNVIDDLSRQRTREILDGVKGDPDSNIGVAYSTYLDTATIDAKGLAPIQPWLNRIKAVQAKSALAPLYAQADRNGIRVPFSDYVGQDDKDPEVYALFLGQSGLGMPDRDYYLSKDPKLAETKAAYLKHLTTMLTLAGEPNAAARAAAILAFETRIAQVSWTRTESRDANKTYNKMTVDALSKAAPGFDFKSYFSGIGAPVDTVIVSQPSAVTGIAKLIQATPLAVLKDQLLVRSLHSFSDVLPSQFDKEDFAFNGTVLSGTPEQQARWKRGVDFTVGALSDDVSKLYVAKYFPPETKAAADKLVKNVIAAMGERIDQLDWMSPETKVKAHQKLAAFTPKIGYPDRWRGLFGAGDRRGRRLRQQSARQPMGARI